jgi:hypothetical protein
MSRRRDMTEAEWEARSRRMIDAGKQRALEGIHRTKESTMRSTTTDPRAFKAIPNGTGKVYGSPYGPRSEHSYFADIALAKNRKLPDALARLAANAKAAAEREERAVTTGTMGGLVPGGSGLPLWADAALSAAVRSSAPLFDALLKIPLPPEGVEIQFAHFTAGTSAARTRH